MRIWGRPIDYKGIKICPVRMGNSTDFYDNIGCLLIEKNKIQDIQIIKMSYLDFLFALTREYNEIFDKLTKILDLILLGQEYTFKLSNMGEVILTISGIEVSGFEFESLRKIILEENGIEFKEDFFDPELEKALQSAEEFMANKSGNKPATLEERIVAYHCLSGIDYSVIEQYTLFQFNKGLERFAIIKNFDTYSAVLAENGASDQIQHWLCHLEEKGRYADVIMSKEEFDKITSDKDIFGS